MALLLLLAGCGSFSDDPPINECSRSDECGTGSCDEDLDICVAPPASEVLRVGLIVTPATEPLGGSVHPVAFEPQAVDGPRDLSLPLGVRTTGMFWDPSESAPVSAAVRFTLASRIPGAAPTVIEASASSDVRNDTEYMVDFNLATQLLPDELYDVSIAPTGDWRARRPPRLGQFRTGDPGAVQALPFEYPPLCAPGVEVACLDTMEGHLRTPVDMVGVNGMLVRLVDATTGQTLSSTMITAAQDTLEDGHFELVFDSSIWEREWFLQVTPTADLIEERGPSQTFTVDPAGLFEIEGLVTILTPRFEELQISYAGTVEDSSARPIADATLRFSSTDIEDPETGTLGSHSTTTRTDSSGNFEVTLLRGTYDIVVTPDSGRRSDGSELAVLREERLLQTDGAGQLFTVPDRAPFSGNVRTAMGLPMFDASVRGHTRHSDLDGTLDSSAIFARSSDAMSDHEGLFGLPLDIGVYDLVVIPPPNTGYPWAVEADFPVGSLDAVIERTLTLENPVPLTGVASFDGPDGPIAVAGGEIRAYAVIENDAGVRAIHIGTATTDEEGHYTLLLPPRL